MWFELKLQQNQGSALDTQNKLSGSETGSRWPSFTLHVGSYILYKPINTYGTVAMVAQCASNHRWTSLMQSPLLPFLLNTNKVTLRLDEAISCKLKNSVKTQLKPCGFKLPPLTMFLESLPAAPQPLMAPWAHIAVLTLAKSQPPPAC